MRQGTKQCCAAAATLLLETKQITSLAHVSSICAYCTPLCAQCPPIALNTLYYVLVNFVSIIMIAITIK